MLAKTGSAKLWVTTVSPFPGQRGVEMTEQSHILVPSPSRAKDNGSGELNRENLVRAIYSAAYRSDMWRDILATLAREAGGSGAFIACHDRESGRGRILFSHGIPAAALEKYAELNRQPGAWYRDFVSNWPQGLVHRDTEVFSDAQARSREEFERIKQSAGFGRTVLAILGKSRDRVELLCLGRQPGGRAFRGDDLTDLSFVPSHIGHALSIYHDQLQKSFVEQGALLALNQLPYGAIIVDSSGGIIASNNLGRLLVETGDGIRCGTQGIEFAVSGSILSVRQLIGQGVRKTGETEARGPNGHDVQPLVVPRKQSDTPLFVSLIPAGALGLTDVDNTCALVVIADPTRTTRVNGALLRKAFGLTPAETRVADLIIGGKRLADAPTVLSITEGTARTHLKRIFSKTGAVSQADLVRLVMNCGPPNGAE